MSHPRLGRAGSGLAVRSLVAGSLLVAVCFVVTGDAGRAWITVAAGSLAALLGAFAARRDRDGRTVWALVAAAMAINAVADTCYNLAVTDAYPSFVDALYLAYYPLLGAALWTLTRRRGADRASLLDAAVVAVGSGALIWQYLMVPLMHDGTSTLAAKLVSVGYPAGDLMLLAFLTRLVLGAPKGARAVQLLGAAGVTMLAADLLYLATNAYGTYQPGSLPDVGYVLAYLLIAAATQHPAHAAARERRKRARSDVSHGRMIVLSASAVLAPAAVVLRVPELRVPALAAVVVLLLIRARVSAALRTLARSGERRFESLVAHSSELVVIVDGDRVRYVSPSVLRAAGVDATGGEQFELDKLVHPDDNRALQHLLVRAEHAPGAGTVEGEFRVRWADGSWRVVAAVATNLLQDDDVRGIVLNAHDIHELRQLASFDPLTGLANRAEFRHRLSASLCAATPLNVLFLDLDGFKEVNDSLGHLAGDEVLVHTAARLAGLVQRGDLVARLGGDEFAVLQVGAQPPQARRLADQLMDLLAEPLEIGGITVRVGASVGIVHDDGRSVPTSAAAAAKLGEELVRCADIAMYRAKYTGRGRAMCYAAAMDPGVQRPDPGRRSHDRRSVAAGDG